MVADITKKSLIIVESPKKANTIQGFLKGYPFKVVASKGHVMDLDPRPVDSNGSTYGVHINDGYKLDYVIPSENRELIEELKKDLRGVSQLILATDEDREGESIAYHLKMLLKPTVPTYRMVFHEITKKAIEEAFNNCRDINMDLVMAQEARRVVDRLQGYGISPILMRKLGRDNLSAGRVQSPALKMIVERERVRRRFEKSGYYSVEGIADKSGHTFPFTLESIKGVNVATSSSYNKETGEIKEGVIVLKREDGERIAQELSGKSGTVISKKTRDKSETPPEPFITSTLQQDAGNKLRMSSKDVMRVAQSLYENGFITYMRTDSPNLSEECINAARKEVESLFGKGYLSKSPRNFKAKSPGAQEAHEAIRPAGEKFRSPEETGLKGKDLDLYTLIWKRTLSTQMREAEYRDTSIKIESSDYVLSSGERKTLFDGFRKLYTASSEDEEEESGKLPLLSEGDTVDIVSLDAKEHVTAPPKRYTEPSLVRKLESDEIGRPSTYAQIISTLLERNYVVKEGSFLVPTFTGFFVESFMEEAFPKYIDYGFTKKMEAELDKIAEGEMNKDDYLNEFWFGEDYSGGLVERMNFVKKDMTASDFKVLELENLDNVIEENGESISYQIKMGKFGPYLNTDYFNTLKGKYEMASINEKKYFPGEFSIEDAKEILKPKDAIVIGGRYAIGESQHGKYIKRIEDGKLNSWYLKGNAEDASEELLDIIFSTPRIIGVDESGVEADLYYGKYGFYIVYGNEKVSLGSLDPVNITMDDVQKLKKGKRDLGLYKENPIRLLHGKYGYYLQAGKSNYRINKSDGPADEIDHDKALSIIERNENREKAKEYKAALPAPKTTRGKGASKRASSSSTCKPSTSTISTNLFSYKELPIDVMSGKFGPYLRWNGNNYKILSSDGPVSSLSAEKAIEIIQRKENAPRSATSDGLSKAEKVWELPEGRKVGLFSGRYGYFLREGRTIYGLKGEEKKNPLSLSEERIQEIVDGAK